MFDVPVSVDGPAAEDGPHGVRIRYPYNPRLIVVGTEHVSPVTILERQVHTYSGGWLFLLQIVHQKLKCRSSVTTDGAFFSVFMSHVEHIYEMELVHFSSTVINLTIAN